jgi:hypothetical protein
VEVVITRLDRLRDSNPAWSGLWRLFLTAVGQQRDRRLGREPVRRGQRDSCAVGSHCSTSRRTTAK